jgi:CRP/FNR family transcriptional regulator, cyclic AMP receptor protein
VPLDVAALQAVPLFGSLSAKELTKLLPLFHERSFEAGHVIAEEGAQGISFFVIESGRAKVTVRGEERTSLGPGSYFGEVAALDPGPRVATVTAETDLEAHVLDAWDFRPLVKEDPALASGIIEGLIRIVRRLEGY